MEAGETKKSGEGLTRSTRSTFQADGLDHLAPLAHHHLLMLYLFPTNTSYLGISSKRTSDSIVKKGRVWFLGACSVGTGSAHLTGGFWLKSLLQFSYTRIDKSV
jgi:hypothetical protein